MHLILWDPADLEIAGAYRLGDCAQILQKVGSDGLYTQAFYQFDKAMSDIHAEGLELGRSFVQPRYWGKRSLDYLWMGIGAFCARGRSTVICSARSVSVMPCRTRRKRRW